MLSAFFALGLLVLLLSALAAKRHRAAMASSEKSSVKTAVPLLTTAMILGIGLGGFIDGIVLHQILQWHEMLAARIPPTNYIGKSVTMFRDGIFHAFTLLVTISGILLLWRLLHRNDIERSGYWLSGSLLLGWGLFNVVGGVLDHQLLKLHNVKEVSANPEAGNFSFLGLSVLMMGAGYWLTKQRSKA